MTGKVLTLPKPLVVLEKAGGGADAAGGGTRYRVKAVLRRKLLFEDRPQPIVSARNATRVG